MNIESLTAEELYDGIGGYEGDSWVDSPEYLELKKRLNSLSLLELRSGGYIIPNYRKNEKKIEELAKLRKKTGVKNENKSK